jgi:phospholipase D1/2
VVVDNRLAFIGGLDLCFGRYDSHQHSLSDYYPHRPEQENFPGQDYSNPRKKDFVDGKSLYPTLPQKEITLTNSFFFFFFVVYSSCQA